MELNKNRWAVVGGGIMGMFTAYRLAQKGYDVTLFEAAKEVGGLASSWQIDKYSWDKFYHVILASDSYLLALLDDLNLKDNINWIETKTGFYSKGKLYSMSNIVEFLKFPPINLYDKFRLGLTIFYASKIKNWKKLEEVLVEDWLTKISGKNVFEKIWLPLLKAKLGETYKKTSASFIWTTIQRMYAARRSGLKKEMFGYVTGSYARILQEFKNHIEALGVKVKTGSQVNEIKSLSNYVHIELVDGTVEKFNEAIVTLPSTIAKNICKQLSAEEKKKHESIDYLGVICPSVILKKPLSDYYVTNIINDSPFTGIIEMTALVDKKYFGGNSLVYLPKYLPSNDPAFKIPDDEIKKEFINSLLKMYPKLERSDVIAFEISRAKLVFALPTKNYSENLPPVKTSMHGVYILNSAHIVNGTLNVNETIQLAEVQLKKILMEKNSMQNSLHKELVN